VWYCKLLCVQRETHYNKEKGINIFDRDLYKYRRQK
jgi:hypothetical protein